MIGSPLMGYLIQTFGQIFKRCKSVEHFQFFLHFFNTFFIEFMKEVRSEDSYSVVSHLFLRNKATYTICWYFFNMQSKLSSSLNLKNQEGFLMWGHLYNKTLSLSYSPIRSGFLYNINLMLKKDVLIFLNDIVIVIALCIM